MFERENCLDLRDLFVMTNPFFTWEKLMIDVIFDKNYTYQTFDNRACPIYTLQTSGSCFAPYLTEAKKFVSVYARERFVIVTPTADYEALNLFATAVFCVSLIEENVIDGLVLKVTDKDAAMTAYRPFIALFVALKYVARLYQEGAEAAYREIADMAYLGLDVKMEYVRQQIVLHHQGREKFDDFVVDSTPDALVAAGFLKIIALLEKDVDVSAHIHIRSKDVMDFDIYDVICTIVKKFLSSAFAKS